MSRQNDPPDDGMHEHHEISCLEAIEAFYAYLDGELDEPGAIAEFEHHLEHCRSCFSRIEMEQLLTRRLKETAGRKAPATLKNRVRKLMDRF